MRRQLPDVTLLHLEVNFARLDDLVLMIPVHLARQFEFYNGADSLLGVSHRRDLRFEINRYLGRSNWTRRFYLSTKYWLYLFENSFQGAFSFHLSARRLSHHEQIWVPDWKHVRCFPLRSLACSQPNLFPE